MIKPNKKTLYKVVSFCLALLMTIELVPFSGLMTTAEAADSELPNSVQIVALDFTDGNYRTYESKNGLGTPTIHEFRASAGAGNGLALCLSHGEHMGSKVAPPNYCTWVGKTTLPSSFDPAKPYLAWLYYHAEKGDKSDWELLTMNAWIQSAVWLAKEGTLTGNIDNDAPLLAKERTSVLASYDVHHSVEDSETLIRQLYQSYGEGKWGNWNFYKYDYGKSSPYDDGKGVQSIMLAEKAPDPGPEGNYFYLQLDKIDEDGNALAGATFGVFKDESCTEMLAEFSSSATLGNVSDRIKFPDGVTSMTVYVKETAAPPGYELTAESTTPHPVSVSADANGTKETAARVDPGKITNSDDKHEDTTPEDDVAIIKKLDAATGLPVEGAVFHIEGQAFDDQIVTSGTTTLTSLEEIASNYASESPSNDTLTTSEIYSSFESESAEADIDSEADVDANVETTADTEVGTESEADANAEIDAETEIAADAETVTDAETGANTVSLTTASVAASSSAFELPVVGATGFAGKDITTSSGDTISAGTAFTIIEDKGSTWSVKTSGGIEGDVATTYCFINLPDILPSIQYNITNAESALYKSRGISLTGVTGEDLYGDIKLSNARLGYNEYLVPVLYSMAGKIASAQQSALANGDCLIIYDGYRPNEVQKKVKTAIDNRLDSSSPEYSQVVYDGINSGGWSKGWFISQNISNHQRGCAIDVSLGSYTATTPVTVGGTTVNKPTSVSEYGMPTTMHELSVDARTFESPETFRPGNPSGAVYSKAAYPNVFVAGSPPDKLEDYCINAGLTPLASEWWHFDDWDSWSAVGGSSTGCKGTFYVSECLSTAPEDAATAGGTGSSSGGSGSGGSGSGGSGETGGGSGSGGSGETGGGSGGSGETGGGSGGTGSGGGSSSGGTVVDPAVAYVSMDKRTDASGCITLQWWNPSDTATYIPPGQYTVTEKTAPPGYELNTEAQHLVLEYDADTGVATQSGPIIFSNNPLHVLEVRKYSEDGSALPGAMFEIYRNGAPVYSAETDENGKIVYAGEDEKGIEDGLYTITETSAPEGYLIPFRHTQYIDIDSSDTHTLKHVVVFNNYKYPDIVIKKKAQGSEVGLPGAQFNVMIDATSIGSFTTDKNGEIVINYATYGRFLDHEGERDSWTVTVEEEVPPDGYFLEQDASRRIQTGEIEEGGHLIEFSFSNQPWPTLKVEKYANGTTTPLQGAIFELKIDGTDAGTFVTDPDGTITLSYQDYRQFLREENDSWTFSAREISAPDEYMIDNDDWQTVEVNKGQTLGVLTFTDTKYPRLIIQKYNNGKTEKLDGARFEIQFDTENALELVTGDKDRGFPTGEIIIDYETYGRFLPDDGELDKWTVSVRETDPPDGYLLDDDNWHEVELLKGNRDKYVSFEDTPYPEIIIKKIDRETLEPLAGTTFRIVIDGTSFEAEKATDENGEIHITYEEYRRFLDETDKDKLDWTVTVTELYPTANYNRDKQLTSGDYTQTQQLKYGQSQTVFTFEDTSFRDVKVYKKDADTNWLLSGATFTLHCIEADDPKDGADVTDRVLTTNEDGYVLFEDVPNGTYTLHESSAPFGYSMNGYWSANGDRVEDDDITIIITSDNDPVIEFIRYNEPQSGLLIRKIDSVTKQPIPNVRFKITPHSPLDKSPWEATTDDNGVIVEENLPMGTYSIQEIATVDGYVLNDEIKTVSIDEQHDAYTFTFENNQKDMLNILKLDSNTRQPVQGAMFEIRTAGGAVIAQVTTGMYGYASYPNLEPGSYVVQEIMSPLGYEIDPMPQTFEITEDDSGKVITLVFCNTPYANLYIRKYDEVTKKGLEGAEFKIWRGDGSVVMEQAITDAAGFIHLEGLTTDHFTIQETKAPDGYLLDDTLHQIYIQTGETRTLEISNKAPGGLTVTKVDVSTGLPLEGAEFELRDIAGNLISNATTDKQGIAKWTNLDPGYYVLTETKAPTGYVISTPASQNIEVKEFVSTQITWANGQKATLTITKRDKDTEEPLSGATFEVRTMNGELAATLTTDATGTATTDRLIAGWYRVTETKAPAGYILNEGESLVEIKENIPAELNFYNTARKGILIHKVDSVTKEPVAGAVLEIWDAGDNLVDTYTTDASGNVNTKALEPGYYSVVETKAPVGYVLDSTPHRVEVEEGKQAVITIENVPQTVIRIYKVDATTGDPLRYAEFEISKYDGTIIGYTTTDETGWAASSVLTPGEYVVKETKAPSGYTVDPTEYRATVKDGESTIVRIEDYPDTVLHISKVNKETRKPVEGAEFEVWSDTGSDIKNIIGTYTTDEFGMIHTDPLTPGYYLVKETYAPDGYVLDEEEHRVYVEAGKYNQLVLENVELGILIVRKIDSKSGEPVPGAVFKVENAATSDLVGTLETDANGEAIFTGLTAGFYIVTETQAPEGYTESNCPKTIEVEYGKRTYVDFKDDENGSLVIILQDKHTGDYLPGGQFTVIRMSDQVVVYDASTDISGTIVVGNLVPGWYEVTQVYAPENYTMVDITTKVEVLIGEQQTVYFKDETCSMVIEKVDALDSAKMLEGARFQVKRDADGIVIGEYVTGKDGLALVGGLSDGLYTVTELVAPDNYAIDEGPKTVHVRGGTAAHVNFQDTALSSITIHVVDNDQKPLAGVKVEVWQQNGQLVNTYTSDSTGVIMTDKIAAGMYVLKVVDVPAGYVVSSSCTVLDSSMQSTVQLTNGIETTFSFDIQGTGTLKLISVDASGKALPGAKLTVTTLSGAKIGTYTTESDGTYIVKNLTAGWYVVTEDKAPENYTGVTAPQNVQVSTTTAAEVTFEHKAFSSIILSAVDVSASKPVTGVKVEIRTQAGLLVGNYTSDSTGIIRTEKLENGVYTIKVTEVPDGYTLKAGSTTIDSISMQATVEVKAGVEFTMDIELVPNGSMKVIGVDEDNNPVSGMQFTVTTQSGTKVGTYTTNANGYVIVTGLAAGYYVVTLDKVPSGYTTATTSTTVLVSDSKSVDTTFSFETLTNITINAINMDNAQSIAGVTVELWQNNAMVGSYVTDSSGSIQTDKLNKNASYEIKIVSVPDGYTLVSGGTVGTTASVNVGTTLNLELTYSNLGDIKIMCVDENKVAVADAVVTITKLDGAVVGEYTSGKDGAINVTGLTAGWYVVKETEGPDGYTPDSESHNVEVTNGTTTNVTIKHTSLSSILISAADFSGNPLQGVKVEIRTMDETLIGTYTSDVDGNITVQNLVSGSYIVKVIRTPDGYTLSTDDSGLDSDGKTTINVKNSTKLSFKFSFETLGSLKVMSVDADNKAISGVTVNVTTLNGTIVGTYTTGGDGSVTVSKLAPGWYIVKETKTPDGYTSDSDEHRVEISAGTTSSVTLSHSSLSSIRINVVNASDNKPIEGVKVEIRTLNETLIGTYTSNVDGSIVMENLVSGPYTIKVVSAPSGYVLSTTSSTFNVDGTATIELKNDTQFNLEFDLDVSGSLRVMSVDEDGKAVPGMTITVSMLNGAVIGTYTTGKDGSVDINNLASGWYVVKETKTPDGYASNTESHNIEITSNTTSTLNITHSNLSSIFISAADSFGKSIQGVKVELRTLAGVLVGTYTSDVDGNITITNISAGTYTIKVTSVPDGYTLSTDGSEFDADGKMTIDVKNSTNLTFDFSFETLGSLKIMSVDADGKAISGVTVSVTTLNGTIIGTYTTGSNGSVTVSKLDSGWYIVKETKTPDGYTADSEEHRVEISASAAASVTLSHSSLSNIRINVVDASTSNPIEGVKVEIRTLNETLVGTYTSGSDGSIVAENLASGSYTVKVVGAPSGYVISNTSSEFDVNGMTTIDLKNDVQLNLNFNLDVSGSLRVMSVDESGKAVSGMTVTVSMLNGAVIGTYTTGKDGSVDISNLTSGWYVVKETKAPDGYAVNAEPYNIEIISKTTSTVNISHSSLSSIFINAADSSSKPIQGIKVELHTLAGVLVGTYTSDVDGIITISKLTAGTYTIKVTSMPDGYTLSTAGSEFDADGKMTIEVKNNTNLTFNFSFETLGSLRVMSVDKDGKAVSGMTVTVSTLEGVVVGTYTTGKDGSVDINKLASGWYVVKETKAPDGYTVNTEPYNVEITSKTTSTVSIAHSSLSSIFINAADVSGKPIQGVGVELRTLTETLVGTYTSDVNGDITIANLADGTYVIKVVGMPDGYTLSTANSKFDADGKMTIEVKNNTNLTFNFSFETLGSLRVMSVDEDGKAVSGMTVTVSTSDGVVVGTYTTGKDGSVDINKLASGRYVVKETKAPDGYSANAESYNVEITSKTTSTVSIAHNFLSSILISAVDTVGNPIQGAKVELRTLTEALVGTYTSDVDGNITIANLTAGTYTIKVTSMPDGYTLSTTGTGFDADGKLTIDVKDSTKLTFNFTFETLGSLRVMSVDADGKAVSGMTVTVSTLEGVVVGTYTTGKDGSVDISKLASGWYVVKETKAPDGYSVNAEPYNIEITSKTTSTVKISHSSLSSVLISAVDASGKPIQGVKVELRTLTETLIGTYTSGIDGNITIANLTAGTYTIKVTGMPDGYTLSSSNSEFGADGKMTIDVKDSTKLTFNFTFETLGSLRVMSVDTDGKAVPGMTITVSTLGGTVVGTYTTGKDGSVDINKLASGWYVVKETNAPDGYSVNAEPNNVEITSNTISTLNITHNSLSSILISVVDTSSSKPIQGIKVEIRTLNEALIGTYTSDIDGNITAEKLTAGTYTVKVIGMPDGYTLAAGSGLDADGKTVIEVKNNTKLTFKFDFEVLGSLKVLAVDADGKALSGATVSLTTLEGLPVGTYTTGNDGSVTVNKLASGWYIVKETKGPDGYTSDSEAYNVEITSNATSTVTLKHTALSSILISIVDASSSKPIQGVKVEIRTLAETLVGTYTSGVDGSIVTEKLAAGTYTIKVVGMPDGYTLSTADSGLDADGKTTIELKNGVQLTFKFDFKPLGSLKIMSVDAEGKALSGVEVSVTTLGGTPVGTYTTGKDGSVTVNKLDSGWYIVKETKGPDGYATDSEPQNVEVTANTTSTVTFKHTSLSSILISMVDASSGTPIQGVKVEIRRMDEALVGTYTSDIDGNIITEKLAAGTYVIKVVSMPDGYALAAADSGLDADGKTTIELKNGVQLTFRFDFKPLGSLKIMSVNNSGKAVSGMTVSITTLEGTPVGTYTTGADGSALVNNLASGWYVVKETKAPNGCTMSANAEQRVEIKAGVQAELTFTHGQVYGLQVTTTNKQTSEKVQGAVYDICKMDGTAVGTYTSGANGLFYVELEPGWYTIAPKTAPSGYTFEDMTAKNIEVKADSIAYCEFFLNQMSSMRIKVVDGDTKKGLYNVRLQLKGSDSVIQEFYTDSEGYITLNSSLLSDGYTMEMISAPSGYIVDTLPRNVKTMFGATTEVTWAIYSGGGQIQVVVKSADYNGTLDKAAGSVLQGAVFEITNPDTYQVVGTMISDNNGVAASKALPIGRYIVKMVSAPAYYAVNESFSSEVRLKVKNDVVRVETTVKSVTLSSNITLQSNTSIKAGNTMRVDITAAKNGSDVRLDNFYLHIKVPTDAARITTLSTGTWNKSVFYSISYKTNMHDYRTLAKNLQSTNVYQYGLSTQTLGLQSGEYVTDVRMEFGTVPAGFAIVQKPVYTQYVMATVYNGYKLISRVELGGQHNTVNVSTNHIDNNNPYSSTGAIVIVGGENAGTYGGSGDSAAISGNSGQWSTSTGIWTTTVTSSVQPPATLPKTGY